MLPVHSVLDSLRTQLSAILRDEWRASSTLASMQEAHLLQTFHELKNCGFKQSVEALRVDTRLVYNYGRKVRLHHSDLSAPLP